MDQTHILQKENFTLKLKEKELQENVKFLQKNQDSALLKALEKKTELETVNAKLLSENETLKKKMQEMELKMKEMEKEQILLEYKLEKAQGNQVSIDDNQDKNPLLKREIGNSKPRIKLIIPKTGRILFFSPDDNLQLPLSLVQKEHPETTAIKYRLKGGNWRMLILENGNFHPPDEGWGDREYEIVNQSRNVVSVTGSPGSKNVNATRPTSYNPAPQIQGNIPGLPTNVCVPSNPPLRPLMGSSPYSYYTSLKYSSPPISFYS